MQLQRLNENSRICCMCYIFNSFKLKKNIERIEASIGTVILTDLIEIRI